MLKLGSFFVLCLFASFLLACDGAESSKTQQTKHRLEVVSSALQAMYLEIGRFPTSDEGPSLLFDDESGLSGWAGPYAEHNRILEDSWGEPLLYGMPEAKCFQLSSFGPNRVNDAGTKDDIVGRVVCADRVD